MLAGLQGIAEGLLVSWGVMLPLRLGPVLSGKDAEGMASGELCWLGRKMDPSWETGQRGHPLIVLLCQSV